tara:strand:+ start:644 stop:1330 length:687 start_codon:yes stop_codon:yes gene_type:complete
MDEELVVRLYEHALDMGQRSHCHKLQVGAALVLPDGSVHGGANGSVRESCLGSDYCSRSEDPRLQYLTCPSACAEGTAIIGALHGRDYDYSSLKGGEIVTTIFPCDRCVDLIIGLELDAVYFGSFKNGVPRPIRLYHVKQMEARDLKVFKIKPEAPEGKRILTFPSQLSNHFHPGFTNHEYGAWYHLRVLLDQDFREQELEHIQDRPPVVESDRPEDWLIDLLTPSSP